MATVQTIAVAVVPRLLTRVRSDHPSLRVEVRDLASRHAIRSVSAGEADVAVVPQYDTAPPATPTRHCDDIICSATPIVVALPPDHRLAHTGTAVDLADLADERWVTGDPDGHFGRLVPSLCPSCRLRSRHQAPQRRLPGHRRPGRRRARCRVAARVGSPSRTRGRHPTDHELRRTRHRGLHTRIRA